jgi:hypothetical protein
MFQTWLYAGFASWCKQEESLTRSVFVSNPKANEAPASGGTRSELQ